MSISHAVLFLCVVASQNEPTIQRHGTTFTECAVVVDNAPLAHTAQLLAGQEHRESPEAEVTDVFRQFSNLLKQFGSRPSDIVKLNLYVADSAIHDLAIAHLEKTSPAGTRPAVTSVTTALPQACRIGLDAVFVARDPDVNRRSVLQPQVQILPPGDVVYISGQASPGNLQEATRSTLEGLLATLRFMKLDETNVVQIKCFLQPMKDVAIAKREITRFFGEGQAPPVSFVEWIAGGARPIEIEWIASAPKTTTTETVSYHTPPHLKPSGVFSRVARIHGSRRIYTSGLVADADARDAESEVHSVYQKLIRLLKPTRANLRHMAKATYYVADPEASSQLNAIRPHYYDPKRPPAASKAMVHGVGVDKRGLALDIIAAPEAPLNRVTTPLAEKLEPSRRAVYKTVNGRPLHLHIFEPKHSASQANPAVKGPRAVFLAIHGGGWTSGNARTFYPFAEHFARQGMVGISLEYRLRRPTGATVFDCVRDARSAVRWIRAHAQELNIAPDQIVAMGGSAGGHLAVASAMFDSINEAGEDASVSATPNLLLLMYPVIDTSALGYGQQKIGSRWRELSPVHQLNHDVQLPPTLIFHGTGDDVTPYPAAKEFHQRAVAAGNVCDLVTQPAGRHGYIIFDQAEYDRAIAMMSAFIRKHGLAAPPDAR